MRRFGILFICLLLTACSLVTPSLNSQIDAYLANNTPTGEVSLEVPGSTHEKQLHLLAKWLIDSGIPVGLTDISDDDDLFGFTKCPTGPGSCFIVIDSSRSINTQYATLSHEACHALYYMATPIVTKATAEIVCEMVAYKVSRRTGLDTTRESFLYIRTLPAGYRAAVLHTFRMNIDVWSAEIARAVTVE